MPLFYPNLRKNSISQASVCQHPSSYFPWPFINYLRTDFIKITFIECGKCHC
jgi:hypothetical protein